jgi:hypothetical protein
MAEFVGRFRAFIAVLFDRPFCGRRRQSSFPLERLLTQSGVPRSVTPELLTVARLAGLQLDGEGSGDGDGDGEEGGDSNGDGDGGDGEGSGDGDGDGDEGGDSNGKTAQEARKELRRYERTAKAASKKKDKELAKLREDLQKREDAEKSEQEKAVEQARKEAREEALGEAEKDRRSDRLESAVVRLAGKKLQIGEDDKAKQVRFDDPEDAEIFLRRKVQNGDVDEDDLFDENGKVNTKLVEATLREILEEKPRLAEDAAPGKSRTPEGSGDGGKGGEAEGGDGDMNAALRRRR